MNEKVKPILRKQILQYRKILPTSVWEERNLLIQQRVIEFISRSSISVIHSFLPIAKNREVNTWPIINEMIKLNRKVIISSTDTVAKSMHHYYYRPDLEFQLNALQIPEPENAKKAEMAVVELILVPLLAADKKGNRIGYGQGYYDKLMQPFPELKKVGLTLGPLFDAFSFTEKHDIQLDSCISPFETHLLNG